MLSLQSREWVSVLTVRYCLDKFNTEPLTFCQVRHDYYPGPVNTMQSMSKFYTMWKIVMKHIHYIYTYFKM